MMNNTKKTGFSLVELLVAMAIIAVLLGLVVFGIGLAQQNSRDTQRRSKVSDVNLALTQYQSSNGNFPQSGQISSSGEDIIIGNPGSNQAVEIPLTGATTPSQETNASSTAYYYDYDTSGSGYYYFCAQLESQNGTSFALATNDPSKTTADANAQCSGYSNPL